MSIEEGTREGVISVAVWLLLKANLSRGSISLYGKYMHCFQPVLGIACTIVDYFHISDILCVCILRGKRLSDYQTIHDCKTDTDFRELKSKL